MAAFVNHKLPLEQQVEVVGLLVLHDTHLHWFAVILVIKILGPKRRRSLLILNTKSLSDIAIPQSQKDIPGTT